LAKKIPNIVKEIRKNPPQEINYAYQQHVSYSQMSLFRQCPHRWKLQYKDKIKVFTSSIHTVFGTAIHEVMQQYLSIMYEESKVKANDINLEELFQEKFINEYQKQYKSNKKSHFSSAEEMREFFEDGIAILKFFKKNVSKYFSKRGTYLVGCEVPIITPPNKMYTNVLYQGFLDVVLYNENTEEFEIIDIKTSTRGWDDRMKKNEDKQFQLILYKQFFSDLYGVPLDKIDIKFFIVKRKIWEKSDWPQTRIQEFVPASGKVKLNRANNAIKDFVDEVFNSNGEIKNLEYPKQVSKWNCTFCPFKEDQKYCGEGIIF